MSEKGKEKLREWWKPKRGDKFLQHDDEVFYGECSSPYDAEEYQPDRIYFEEDWKTKAKDLPLFSIGQMLEFLDEKYESWREGITIARGEHVWYVYTVSMEPERTKKAKSSVELCNALWEAVKELINQT